MGVNIFEINLVVNIVSIVNIVIIVNIDKIFDVIYRRLSTNICFIQVKFDFLYSCKSKNLVIAVDGNLVKAFFRAIKHYLTGFCCFYSVSYFL